ncbi:hypothetical protein KPH14_006207 [Odynerus spinipes]|uniref:Neural proliferation differentiation and control protein 1 n=1 Tax=Odynerus spinipes TaxID=1348599 RepID=A0AAD9RJA1_9HYME|nr:hypothetical protein KPH14_006207 [Odynerus spinipes]
MSFSLFTFTWLISFGVLVNLSYGELEFNRDIVPETSQDITSLKQFVEYITDQNRKQRLHHSYFLPFLIPPIHKKHHFDLSDQEKHEFFKSLKEKFHLDDGLREQKLTAWNYMPRIKPSDLKEPLPKNDYNLMYYDLNSMPKNLEDYSSSKLPYKGDKLMKENQKYRDIDVGYLQDKIFPRQSLYNEEIEEDANKGELTNFFKNNMMSNNRRIEEDKSLMQPSAQVPEFTYYFDISNLNEKHPFAVQPYDPRYYEDSISPVDTRNNLNHQKVILDPLTDTENVVVKDSTATKQVTDVQTIKHDEVRNASVRTLTEKEKSENHPFVVSIAQDLNSDIYFIAVIAGCSAAAMFIFVLISLTWCRLQRGVKAAADIEYPAYGVTGPNKDVSPSEDQRLAQSAQMYHFQHQKQQIIAMENRTSATRDPGSLSEAESDEENEEGDYTVYECPGLASTGEMEVKNPLFHDDPTPATPANTNKEEDHM